MPRCSYSWLSPSAPYTPKDDYIPLIERAGEIGVFPMARFTDTGNTPIIGESVPLSLLAHLMPSGVFGLNSEQTLEAIASVAG